MTRSPINIIKNYVPESSLPILQKWFEQRPFELRIPKKRASKFGDFRASTGMELPKISVNGNLNEYAFLITLTHEFAHLLVWHQHKHHVKAHGTEWKNEFRRLMQVLLNRAIFPDRLTEILRKHMINPAASSARDEQLIKELKRYDASNTALHLSDLPEGAQFRLNNNRIFIKGKKRRTRYLCTELSSKREYLVHGIAEVTPVG
ncbi:MAG: SprT-like domain-containing protein [Flavobacteriales bacterium]|nr:SprT-like domain-containing protein [Flavobacteriales bacterium]